MNMTEAEKHVVQNLVGVYEAGEAAQIAAMLMEELTALKKSERILYGSQELTQDQMQQLDQQIIRLKNHEPVQYIIGKVWFYGMELFVDRAVLIPRPETEELVDWVVKDLSSSDKELFEKQINEADETKKLKILDVGTGSGCIALALKKTIPKAEVWGCDVSDEALNVARRNGSALNIRVDFQGVDFLDWLQQKSLPTVDVIVSNPPYVPQKDQHSMHRNVLDHEPHLALFVPDEDALIFYKALARFGKNRLYHGGSIYMEIHESLGPAVAELFKNEGYEVELKKDMQGKDRMVKAVKRRET